MANPVIRRDFFVNTYQVRTCVILRQKGGGARKNTRREESSRRTIALEGKEGEAYRPGDEVRDIGGVSIMLEFCSPLTLALWGADPVSRLPPVRLDPQRISSMINLPKLLPKVSTPLLGAGERYLLLDNDTIMAVAGVRGVHGPLPHRTEWGKDESAED